MIVATAHPPAPPELVPGEQPALGGLAAACRRILREDGASAAVAFGEIRLAGDEALGWLGPGEQLALERLTLPKRRQDWLAGRWAAKCAVALLVGERDPGADVEVIACASGAPGVLVAGSPSPLRVSIAHAGQVAGAVAWEGDDVALGLDLEPLVLPDRTLDRIAFTPEESAWAREPGSGAERPLRLWTAKEAVLKAAEVGLRADLRRVEVERGATGAPWHVRFRRDRFRVRHAVADGYVAAIAAGGR